MLLAPSVAALFKWRQFEPEMILLAVGWYLRFSLSYRDVEELHAERGLLVDHVTVWSGSNVTPRKFSADCDCDCGSDRPTTVGALTRPTSEGGKNPKAMTTMGTRKSAGPKCSAESDRNSHPIG